MNNRIAIKSGFFRRVLLMSCALTLSDATFALPEDARQEISIEGGTGELNIEQGIYIIREDEKGLAHIKQGSMEIFGSEIRLELVERVLNKATATGTPARFQQQPSADQAIVFISGRKLDYDNAARTLSIDGDASYDQAGNTLKSVHIDYNLDTRLVKAAGGDNENVRIIIPAPPQTETP